MFAATDAARIGSRLMFVYVHVPSPEMEVCIQIKIKGAI
jgi:hypothetical protein